MTKKQRLAAVKAIHTLVWLIVESAMAYVVVAGLRRRTDRRVAIAAAIVAGETAVFAANGFRCPLTTMAEDLGDEDGSVTDIYLPAWCARSLPLIHVPLIGLAVYLHGRNLRDRAERLEFLRTRPVARFALRQALAARSAEKAIRARR